MTTMDDDHGREIIRKWINGRTVALVDLARALRYWADWAEGDDFVELILVEVDQGPAPRSELPYDLMAEHLLEEHAWTQAQESHNLQQLRKIHQGFTGCTWSEIRTIERITDVVETFDETVDILPEPKEA